MTAAEIPADRTRPTLTVAVITYQRPDGLARLLATLPAHLADVADLAGDVEVLVVDNDPAGGARPVVAAAGGSAYAIEPTPGIAAARNRVLSETAGRDAVVFIDDDEVPSAGWLRALVQEWLRSGATAVSGAVTSRFDVEPDSWVVAGGFFARRHREGIPAGSDLATAATNNLLLDRSALDRLGLRFDQDFGLSGGSDTLFCRTLVTRGERIVWCPDAEVVELVPASRLSRHWLLTRAVSYGTTDSRVAIRLAHGLPGRLRARGSCVARGLPRIGAGAARVLLGRLRRREADEALGLQTLLRGCGIVAGAFGYSYSRYRRPKT